MKKTNNKTESITVHVTLNQKKLIAKAASLRNISITNFITDNVKKEATNVVKEAYALRLAKEKQSLAKVFLTPSRPGDTLKKVIVTYVLEPNKAKP